MSKKEQRPIRSVPDSIWTFSKQEMIEYLEECSSKI